MKRFEMLAGAMLAASLMGACGGDDDAPVDVGICEEVGGEACFELPTVEAKRDDDSAPDWDCAAPVITSSTADIAIMGTAFDFQNSSDPIPNATIEAFDSLDFSTPVAMATADAQGVYSITLPAGMAKSRMNWRTSADGWLDTYALNSSVDVTQTTISGATRRAISELTANALPAFIGVTRTDGFGVLAGTAVDCDGESVKNVIATLSTTSSAGDADPAFVAGPQVYYFSNGSPDLPVRRNKPEDKATKGDGLFVIIEIPPTTGSSHYFLQTWGYKTAADVAQGKAGLSLLSELEAPVVGDSVISVDMTPNQGQ
jgi:hypothetical protein